jgi:hypothetical protein
MSPPFLRIKFSTRLSLGRLLIQYCLVIRYVTKFKFFIAVIPGTEKVLSDFRSLRTLSAHHGGRAV